MSNPGSNPRRAPSRVYDSTYLAISEIEELVKAYETEQTAPKLETLTSFLLAFAFNTDDGWSTKIEHDKERKQINYYVVKVEGKDNKRTLHTIAKVVPSPVEPFPKDWEQTMHNLRTAPMNEDRCWVILIRGLEVRLIEYHRAHEPGVRMIPCDFMIEGRSSETVHIRTNDTEVNSILTRLPLQWPEPLSEIELTCLAVQLKATRIKSNETESFLSDDSLKSSKPTLSDGLKVKIPLR